jgi:hypothetical protein
MRCITWSMVLVLSLAGLGTGCNHEVDPIPKVAPPPAKSPNAKDRLSLTKLAPTPGTRK